MSNFDIESEISDKDFNGAKILEKIKIFARELEQLNGDTKTDLVSFDSGAIMLDIFCQSRMFVLAYSPRNGFGIDEIKDDDGFELGYKFHAENFDTAKEKIKELLESS
jgi:hypothetical protein